MPVKFRPLPSADYLRECFSYDAETGVLRWRVRPDWHHKTGQGRAWNVRVAGSVAGTLSPFGYRLVCLDHHSFAVHRIVLAMNGDDPGELPVDHVNGDRSDNRLSNLRVSSVRGNASNTVLHRRGRGLPVGVSATRGGRFVASIGDAGVSFHLGTFDSVVAARAAYLGALAVLDSRRRAGET